MQIEVISRIEQRETVNVEIPLYRKSYNDYDGSTIFYRIDSPKPSVLREVTIVIRKAGVAEGGGTVYPGVEISIKQPYRFNRHSPDFIRGDGHHYDKSNETEFLRAVQQAREIISQVAYLPT